MTENNNWIDILYFMSIFVTIGIMILALSSGTMVDEKIAIETLEKQGFSNVTILEKQWFLVGWRGCANGDAAKFIASAINPRNQTVELYVCIGWPFKGATIRND